MDTAPTITLHVPHPIRSYCGGARELSFSAPTLQGVLTECERLYPDLYSCVCDETGAVRRHVNLFVNTSHFRDLDGLATPLAPGDDIMILPAVSGG